MTVAILHKSETRAHHSYYVVCIDYGRHGLEAVVDPEITRREVISRIRSGEYRDIAFIHHVDSGQGGIGINEDVTAELMGEAMALEAAE